MRIEPVKRETKKILPVTACHGEDFACRVLRFEALFYGAGKPSRREARVQAKRLA